MQKQNILGSWLRAEERSGCSASPTAVLSRNFLKTCPSTSRKLCVYSRFDHGYESWQCCDKIHFKAAHLEILFQNIWLKSVGSLNCSFCASFPKQIILLQHCLNIRTCPKTISLDSEVQGFHTRHSLGYWHYINRRRDCYRGIWVCFTVTLFVMKFCCLPRILLVSLCHWRMFILW